MKMKCKHPQLVKYKVSAFGTEIQVHYQVPCWYCEECLKVRKSIFKKWDNQRYNDVIKQYFSKKEVDNAKTQTPRQKNRS